MLIAAVAVTAPVLAEPTPVRGGTLVLGVADEAVKLDPILTSQRGYEQMIARNVFSGLVRYNDNMEISPDLATRWELSPDGLSLTFYLRSGVLFHNGTPFTAADVKFSIERLADVNTGSLFSNDFKSVAEVRIIDDLTVQFILSKPDALLLNALCNPSIVMVSKALGDSGADFNVVVVGTGPFMLSERRVDVSTTLVRNPNYFLPGLPYLDKLEFRMIVDDTARLVALRTGEVNFCDRVPAESPELLAELKTAPGVNIVGGPGLNLRCAIPNIDRAPWNNVLVRQAFNMVLDRQGLLDIVLGGYGEPLDGGAIPSTMPGHRAEPCAPRDVVAAKELLAQAGYPNGFTCKILSFGDISLLANTAVVLREQAAQIGINLEVELFELAIVQAKRNARDFDMVIAGIGGVASPYTWLYNPYGTGSARNYNKFSDPQIDALLEMAKAESDPQTQADLYITIQDLLCQSMPMFPLYSGYDFYGLTDNVKGFVFRPTVMQNFLTVWLEP
jgi:peptide/nickel transport system substrate-binding protein